MATKQIQAIVSGRVQGVGYRYFAVHAAQRLGIDGTVRNTADGGVEVIARGAESQLSEFIGELRQGPSAADVKDVRIAWSSDEPDTSNETEHGFHAVA